MVNNQTSKRSVGSQTASSKKQCFDIRFDVSDNDNSKQVIIALGKPTEKLILSLEEAVEFAAKIRSEILKADPGRSHPVNLISPTSSFYT